jgi:predicted dehydrogenase
VEAQMCFPLLVPGNIRYRYDLGGGAMMDAGCYAVNIVRTLAAEEPEVRSARAKLASAKVDRAMEAELAFPSGATGLVRCSMASWRLFGLSAKVRGDRGWLRIFNPVAPHFYHRLRWNDGTTTRRERVAGRATYTHQLEAFAAAVARGEEFPSDSADGEANMRVIDSIYRAAGLPLRGV